MPGPKGQRIRHPVPEPPRAARRHCWVTASPDSPGPHAGLVVWEKRDERWFAQVVYVIEDDDALILQWLPGDLPVPLAG